jgi:hypothetical protein
MQWTADATVLDFSTISKRPAHVTAQRLGGNDVGSDAGQHNEVAFDGQHFLFSRFQP